MKKEEAIKKIKAEKIIVITRGIYGPELLKLFDALYKGGIRCFEMTYDPADPNTMEKVGQQIRDVKAAWNDVLVGVGTVMTKEQIDNAVEAGADMIVSPHFDPKLVTYTLEKGLVSMPGCITPSEIIAADHAGADFIKLFPAGTMGIKYCKDIYAPIHHVNYVATVGVTEETFKEYLDLGFTGAGISSKLVDKKLREAGKWDELTERAHRFVSIAQGK